jgi:membrane protein
VETPAPERFAALRRLPGILASSVSRFFSAGCAQHAAGIAYRVLFSLAPLAIVLLSVFGLVLQDDDLRDRVVTAIVDVLPVDDAGSANVEDAIKGIATPASAAGLISLLAFLWAASAMMGAIRAGLVAAMGVDDERPVVRGKLFDLVLVAGAAVLVLLSVGFGLVAEAAAGFVSRFGPEGATVGRVLATGFPFVLSVVTAMLLYRFVPSARLRFTHALAGASVTAVMLACISLASGLLYARTTQWSLIYGSLTSVLVFLYSVYLYASALLIGASVAAEWGRPQAPGSPEPLREKVERAVRGLFVRQPPPASPPDAPDRPRNR